MVKVSKQIFLPELENFYGNFAKKKNLTYGNGEAN